MERNQIISFVIRFHLTGIDAVTKNKQWRIKVTHVQEDEETLFENMEEAVAFMEKVVKNKKQER